MYLLLSTAICTYGIISFHVRTMVCGGSSTATVFNTLAQSRHVCAKGLLQGLSFLRHHHPTAPFTPAWQCDLSGRNERARVPVCIKIHITRAFFHLHSGYFIVPASRRHRSINCTAKERATQCLRERERNPDRDPRNLRDGDERARQSHVAGISIQDI